MSSVLPNVAFESAILRRLKSLHPHEERTIRLEFKTDIEVEPVLIRLIAS